MQVPGGFPAQTGEAELTDRRTERDVLDRLLDAVRGGESRALVVHGEPGTGKTVLLEYLAERAADCHAARTAGIQSEMELAFAGLHQLCAPLLVHDEALPPPQREALRITFGLHPGPAPDRFLVALAVLSPLSEAAGERPLICLVDDAQWLDSASAQVLAFVARRLVAESVGLVFATRVSGEELAGLPELVIGGLRKEDARALLDSVLTGPLSERVRDQIVAETGTNLAPYGALGLAAMRGSAPTASGLIEGTLRDARPHCEGLAISAAEWAAAVLNNGLGCYTEALAAAQRASENHPELGYANWALVELIEAAARGGETEAAARAGRRLAEMTSVSGTDWGLGVQARSQALLSEGEEAERLYREAIERLSRTRIRVELARAHLLYGEWLRRERRPSEARDQLRTAHDMLEEMGLEAFAARARRELEAAGETARKRTIATRLELTVQEAQIARLARDGLSNPEIGTRLFLSPRTVQYHLGKVFTKLDITSRSQLRRIPPATADTALPR